MTDTPEQWAYDEADNRVAAVGYRLTLARMIQQYEPELKPADPDEAIAAEACAQEAENNKRTPAAGEYRAGGYRYAEPFKAALRAIKLYKESVS